MQSREHIAAFFCPAFLWYYIANAEYALLAIKLENMKYAYIVLALAILAGGGYYFYVSQQHETPDSSAVPAASTGSTPNTQSTQNSAPSSAEVMQMSPSEGSVPEEQSEDAQGTQEGAAQAVVQGSANASASLGTTAQNAKVFNITGHNFAFSQKEIRVKKGDTVTINFESTEGNHNWTIDAFHAATQTVGPGTKASVTFVADQTGTFEYYCSIGSHRSLGMTGSLIVE